MYMLCYGRALCHRRPHEVPGHIGKQKELVPDLPLTDCLAYALFDVAISFVYFTASFLRTECQIIQTYPFNN